MPFYRKRPVVIEARKFDGSPGEMNAVYHWVEWNTLGSFEPMDVIEGRVPCPESGVSIDPRDGRMMIATLEGALHVNVGDYVIRGVAGEFYPCKPEIFVSTYTIEEASCDPFFCVDCVCNRDLALEHLYAEYPCVHKESETEEAS